MTAPRTRWPDAFQIGALMLLGSAVIVLLLALAGTIFALSAKLGLAPWPM